LPKDKEPIIALFADDKVFYASGPTNNAAIKRVQRQKPGRSLIQTIKNNFESIKNKGNYIHKSVYAPSQNLTF